ncbi:MAG: hypothetical protein CBB68_04660 [Rhodospirillaceae bacterium TMED8]|nr:hypothetical protein [Magnetovibrio sp.]OUT51624.1 MAG: hypothetical protein CBB68_04660 [Rhodospirillaceae bacterium TMED8]|tara:strand:- start:520 stop:873 length:354 start_codon:yes stop_codon:yes gene_type:complete
MPRFVDLDKPPFFTALFTAPSPETNAGQFSDALATTLSAAMLFSGFIGFADDIANGNRPVKIVYWKTFHAMQAWQKTSSDLIPHTIDLNDCIASEGCHWQWHEPVKTHTETKLRNVA